MPGPNGAIMHAEIMIGDSPVMLCDASPETGSQSTQSLNGTPVSIFMYVPDVDGFVARATAAGATLKVPLTNMFWGDRYAQLADPYGHVWQVATHVEDVAPDEMMRRATDTMG